MVIVLHCHVPYRPACEASPNANPCASMVSALDPQVVSGEIFQRRWVDTLRSLLASSWDRTRSLSFSTLAYFPAPLPGYPGPNGARKLSREGLLLAGSARQRESDSGALLLRLVFGSYVLGAGQKVLLSTCDDDETCDDEEGCEDAEKSAAECGREGSKFLAPEVEDAAGDHGDGQGLGDDAALSFLEGLCTYLSCR